MIHGRPWVLATEGRVDSEYKGKPLFDAQIIYMPRNPRGAHGYGFPPVEQILITINTALRRETMQLAHFTQSNVPAGMATSPEGWSPDQVKQYQDWFDNLLSGNLGERTKVIWGPSGAKYQTFKEPPFKDDFDEWLARIVSFAFSLPPTWAVRQMNRSTANTAQEVALEEGLAPLMVWVKRLIDNIIQDRMGHTDLEFVWGDKRPVDPSDQQKMLSGYVKEGLMTRNEARDTLGMNPIPGGDDTTVEVAGQGILLVEDLDQISDNIANPPPPAPVLPSGNRPPAKKPSPNSSAKPNSSSKRPAARPASGKTPSKTKKGVAKTLYVHRPLKNADEVRAWAKDAGFKNTLEPDDLHVTVAFSKDPLDWDAAGDHFDELEYSSGQCSVEPLG